jgi:hypothetical protein
MSARDKIAEILATSDHLDIEDYADRILAALPGMIAPLVWEGFISGPYKIEVYDGGIANLWFYGKAIEDDDEHEVLDGGYLTLVSLDDLKECANTHHRAAIMAAFNGEAKT